MTGTRRDETLAKVSPSYEQLPAAATAGPPVTRVADMAWEELGLVVEGLAFSQRPIRAAAREVTRRHNLGPRGAFILSLISGGLIYPLDLATALNIGRSLITAELARLTEAELITARPGQLDRRRSELALTEAGKAACAEVRETMQRIVSRNLSRYTPDEVRLLARMLHDVRQLGPGESET